MDCVSSPDSLASLTRAKCTDPTGLNYLKTFSGTNPGSAYMSSAEHCGDGCAAQDDGLQAVSTIFGIPESVSYRYEGAKRQFTDHSGSSVEGMIVGPSLSDDMEVFHGNQPEILRNSIAEEAPQATNLRQTPHEGLHVVPVSSETLRTRQDHAEASEKKSPVIRNLVSRRFHLGMLMITLFLAAISSGTLSLVRQKYRYQPFDASQWSKFPVGTTAGKFLAYSAFRSLSPCDDYVNNWIGIDAALARLPFTQAKALNFASNLVLGRGIQGVMGVIAYRVFRRTLVKVMERSKICVHIFAEVALHPNNVVAGCRCLAELGNKNAAHVKILIVLFFLSSAWIFTYPSLVDLTIGYRANMVQYVSLPDHGPVVATDVMPPCLDMVLNGIQGDSQWDSSLCTTNRQTQLFEEEFLNFTVEDLGSNGRLPVTNLKWKSSVLQPLWDTAYNVTYITAHADQSDVLTSAWYDDGGNRIAEIETLFEFQCVVDHDSYYWGISSRMTYLVLGIEGLWAFTMWMWWQYGDRNNKLYHLGRRVGTYRAVLDIAEAINDTVEGDLAGHSERELVQAVKNAPRVKYRLLSTENGKERMATISS